MNTNPKTRLILASALSGLVLLVGGALLAHRLIGHSAKANETLLGGNSTFDLEKRRKELFSEQLATYMAPAKAQIEQAFDAENRKDFSAAHMAWEMAHKALLKAAQQNPVASAGGEGELGESCAGPSPSILGLDLGRVRYRLLISHGLGGMKSEAELRRKAENALSDFQEWASNQPVSTPNLQAEMGICLALLGKVQAGIAAEISSWPCINVVEEAQIQTSGLGLIHVKILSPTVKKKEDKGPKYLAVFVFNETKPRFMTFVSNDAAIWAARGIYVPGRGMRPLTRLEREKELRENNANNTFINLSPIEHPKNGECASVMLCWMPNSGNATLYTICREAITFVSGGD
ncbi:MAG TPA: hypothetical protein PKL14_03770 [Holophaga sp.]|nr:hypothetical protein [Holophaga sp.]